MACELCGYVGAPISWRGRIVGCPACERSPDFDAAIIALRAAPRLRLTIRTRPRPTSAVSRNEPCPCGSGIKFKRCHGNGKLARPAA